MRRGRCLPFLPLIAASLFVMGCAQGGGSLSRRPMMLGTLKTEVARLEREKEVYRRQVAELNSENAKISKELAQERAFSSDLENRLADARALLDRRGLAADTDGKNLAPTMPASNWNTDFPPRTQPAADSPQTRRKPPFAQIGGGARSVVEEDEPRDEPPRSSRPPNDERRDGTSPQKPARNEAPVRWLPVADTAAAPSTTR